MFWPGPFVIAHPVRPPGAENFLTGVYPVVAISFVRTAGVDRPGAGAGVEETRGGDCAKAALELRARAMKTWGKFFIVFCDRPGVCR